MSFLDHFKSLKEPEHRIAWAVAIAADALQIAAFPLFAEGALSPADSILDLAVAYVMIRLLGWHWAFLPTAAAKLIPGADLFPTWTTAVWFVTRRYRLAPVRMITSRPITNPNPGLPEKWRSCLPGRRQNRDAEPNDLPSAISASV